MHIPDKAKILLVPRCLTYRCPPFFYQLQYSILYASRMHGRSFGEASDELVEELLGADLKMKRVSAVFDANVEQLER
jgi:hypothetical protein